MNNGGIVRVRIVSKWNSLPTVYIYFIIIYIHIYIYIYIKYRGIYLDKNSQSVDCRIFILLNWTLEVSNRYFRYVCFTNHKGLSVSNSKSNARYFPPSLQLKKKTYKHFLKNSKKNKLLCLITNIMSV